MQYDLNVAYPFDVNNKRSGVDVANAASRAGRGVVSRRGPHGDRSVHRCLRQAALAARLALRTIKDGLARLDEMRKVVHLRIPATRAMLLCCNDRFSCNVKR